MPAKTHRPQIWPIMGGRVWALVSLALVFFLLAHPAFAHAVAQGDKGYIQEISGPHIVPFVYLGAKHMVTGYDHILFLLGVIFFLYGMKEIGLYVTLFAVGHSSTMLLGVWFDFGLTAISLTRS
ncbi:putative hupE/UreJ family protein [Donghicola eburneus]|uniref:Putative hupE/UreJ family protein n=1 Tax=Donghicola eburneus TaxID=393278 RepID=A0A1M4MXK9_9RHOB|nr:putative hupE/UreJ family protein [Donghicola eburneus]